MQDFVGKQIDRYRIIAQQGMGGMAVVYKAYDTRLERDVALKVIRAEAIPADQYARLMVRFEREAKAQAGFSHPNIVPVYDYGEVDGSPYIVMEFIPGGTLKEKLDKPISYHKALNWLELIVSALDYAHRRGVVHRDVKPSNILFDKEGRPILTDFGVAKILETTEATLTGTGLGVGTPEYMAPEQWQGQATGASDQYALGVVLYEMVTGQKPYTAETPVAVALKQMSEPLRRPSELVADIPEKVEKFLYKALALKPGDRFENMHAFRNAIITLLRDEDITPAERESWLDKVDSEGETVDLLEPGTDLRRPSRAVGEIAIEEVASRKPLSAWAIWGGLGVILICLIGIILAITMLGGDVVKREREIEPVAEVVEKPENTRISEPENVQPGFALPTITEEVKQVVPEVAFEEPTEAFTLTPGVKPTAYITPTPRIYLPISGCAASQLHVGDSAFVSYYGGKNSVRSEPDTSKNNKIGEIQPGEVVQIVGGPVCNYGWILWEVENTSRERGWTPESKDGEEFWLLPLTTRQLCEGSLPSRLEVEKRAKVNEDPPDANLLRPEPSRFHERIGRIPPGDWMLVLEGPVCGESTTWWKVEAEATGIIGWTMESGVTNGVSIYYLSPEP